MKCCIVWVERNGSGEEGYQMQKESLMIMRV